MARLRAGRTAGRIAFPWESQWFGLSEARREEVDLPTPTCSSTCPARSRIRGRVPAACGRLAYVDSDPVFTQVKLPRGQAGLPAHSSTPTTCISASAKPCRVRRPMPATGHRWLPDAAAGPARRVARADTARRGCVHHGHELDQLQAGRVPRAQRTGRRTWSSSGSSTCPQRVAARAGDRRDRGQDAAPALGLLERRVVAWSTRRGVPATWTATASYLESPTPSGASRRTATSRDGRAGSAAAPPATWPAGRPVVVQDTGFAAVLPTGEGLLAFGTRPRRPRRSAGVSSDYEPTARGRGRMRRGLLRCRYGADGLIELAWPRRSAGGSNGMKGADRGLVQLRGDGRDGRRPAGSRPCAPGGWRPPAGLATWRWPRPSAAGWTGGRPTRRLHARGVFVCGPFGNGWPITEFLGAVRRRQAHRTESVMLRRRAWNPFDILFERDSSRATSPDLSILSECAVRAPVVGVRPGAPPGGVRRPCAA